MSNREIKVAGGTTYGLWYNRIYKKIENNKRAIGERIKKERKAAGFTNQRDFASFMGYPCEAWQLMELFKRGDIPSHLKKGQEYSETGRRLIDKVNGFTL